MIGRHTWSQEMIMMTIYAGIQGHVDEHGHK